MILMMMMKMKDEIQCPEHAIKVSLNVASAVAAAIVFVSITEI